MPMVFASWVVGMLSEYEQNLPLYGTFSVMNGVLGAMVFFFHCMGSEVVSLFPSGEISFEGFVQWIYRYRVYRCGRK